MSVRIIIGDALTELRKLPDESVHCCVTSPPYYGLRDYGMAGQIGLESSPDEYVAALVSVFGELRRVLRKDGTLWLNIGDSYGSGGSGGAPSAKSTLTRHGADGRSPYLDSLGATISRERPSGLKPKDLIGVPWLLAFALRSDGWYLRQDIIWSKPNPMPESVTDRCTKAHEYLFLLAKSQQYHYDAEAIKEIGAAPREFREETRGDGSASMQRGIASRQATGATGFGTDGTRNKRSVWEVTTAPFPEAHFATFPPALIEPCIKAGSPPLGTVLDPFGGAGTTGLVADRLGRNAILIELNPAYAEMARQRIHNDAPLFTEVA